MSDFIAIEILASLKAFQEAVFASKFRCRTSLASDMHQRAIEKLQEMIESLQAECDRREAWKASTCTRDEWITYGFMFYPVGPFQDDWIENGPVELLDFVKFRLGENGWYHGGEDRWVSGDEGQPKMTRVPPHKLEGLARLLKRIRRKTGIDMRVGRVTVARRGNVQASSRDYID